DTARDIMIADALSGLGGAAAQAAGWLRGKLAEPRVEVQDQHDKPALRGQFDSEGYPKPPGWDRNWTWGPPTGDSKKPSDWRWFDPAGGEWRWHSPDRWHPEGHWDYNPWLHPADVWRNVLPRRNDKWYVGPIL